MRYVVVAEFTEALATGEKTALLMPATEADRFRIGPDWASLDQFVAWKPGQAVEEVVHYGRHRSFVGETIGVRDLGGRAVCAVLIESIQMVNFADLDEDTARALGYPSLEAYLASLGRPLQRRHAWLFRVFPAPPISSVSA